MPQCRTWLKAGLIVWMFLLGILAVSVVMPVSRRLLRRRASRVDEAIVMGWNRAVCWILNLRLRIEGQPDPGTQLWVANHISWLDIIALGSQLPCQFIAKGDVAAWPVVGYIAQGIGTLFVKRGDAGQTASAAELMLWRLRQGRRLLLFPEGTTSTGETVLRFHGKLFQPAQRAEAKIQAIALRYHGESAEWVPFIGEDEFLPHLFRLLKARRIDLSIQFCPALPTGLDRSALASTSHRQIAQALAPSEGQHALVEFPLQRKQP